MLSYYYYCCCCRFADDAFSPLSCCYAYYDARVLALLLYAAFAFSLLAIFRFIFA